MEPVFSVIAILFFVLYIRERRKNREMESNYNYINSRLLAIANTDDSNYILVPTDMGVVRETAKSINSLLEKFYGRQMDYNRNQKAVLQLFTNISHDLRTPITVLKGYIEMLYLQSRKEELSPVLRTTIEKMQRNSEDIVHSVNNLFDMAKIQSGDMVPHIQNVDLTQICHEILLAFYDLLEREAFHVEVNMEDRPLYANVDVEAIRRVLKNLIDNAITHGGAGKFLGISLYENENHICIEVEDHGAGISEKDITHIFTRAYTADRGKGNGLGLAISQGLVGSMGGSISVSSLPQDKTVFTVSLQS